jgi:hypothetical protein
VEAVSNECVKGQGHVGCEALVGNVLCNVMRLWGLDEHAAGMEEERENLVLIMTGEQVALVCHSLGSNVSRIADCFMRLQA